jgi:hypothetical protein
MPAVTAMSSMFAQAGATKFNADFSHWDVSNVRDRNCIFDGAISVGWDNFHIDFNSSILNWINKVSNFCFQTLQEETVRENSVFQCREQESIRNSPENGCFDDGPD